MIKFHYLRFINNLLQKVDIKYHIYHQIDHDPKLVYSRFEGHDRVHGIGLN